MRTSSPLRYPGGKSAMSGLLREIRRLNRFGNREIAEPFAGGAGASLSLLFDEETPAIALNDADPAIHDFWWTLKHRPEPLLAMIDNASLTMDEWQRQRTIYRRTAGVSRLRKAFATFYLNRCNRSGIITNGGPIGGIEQRGSWKLDARFNRADLRRRCERIVEYRERISVSCVDGLDFVKQADIDQTFMFIDPPYFNKGGLLYMNLLDPKYHELLATTLRESENQAWVVTYDDCPEIRALYEGWANIRPFSLRYAAAERRAGCEVLISPKGMRLPSWQASEAIRW
jgi:DNA adenine methylase